MMSTFRSGSHNARSDHKECHPYHPVCEGTDSAWRGLIEATLGAARVRLRPVIMTSLAFFFGVLPLAIATGAGAGA